LRNEVRETKELKRKQLRDWGKPCLRLPIGVNNEDRWKGKERSPG